MFLRPNPYTTRLISKAKAKKMSVLCGYSIYDILDLISLAHHNTVAVLVTMNFGYVTLNHTLIVMENEDSEKKTCIDFKYIHEP